MMDIAAPGAPTANPDSGTYNAAKQVELSAEEGTQIYYTTDGTEPTKQSTLYSGPIAVNDNMIIQGIAVDKAGNQSGVARFDYIIEADDTQLSLNANPQSFTYGEAGDVTLSGKLTSGEPGVASKDVILEKRPYGATSWGEVGTQTTAADGAATRLASPSPPWTGTPTSGGGSWAPRATRPPSPPSRASW